MAIAQQPTKASSPGFDRREVMIPMRDGVKLFTVLMSPKVATEPLPILLMRTPYGARGWQVADSVPRWRRELSADGYIFVDQDIRGCGQSGGVFVMNRPNRHPRDSSATDESTDAYDTIEWLVHNVTNSNDRVGVLGVSYPGWLAQQALIGPHPALRAVSPQAPMADTWMGDDFFHQGAFRLGFAFGYSWAREMKSVGISAFPIPLYGDKYAWFLSFPSLKALTDSTGSMRIPTWRRFVEHPTYDSVWQQRAFPLAISKLSVPTLTVGGWWDQENLYGTQVTFKALERLDDAGLNHLVIGPWFHGMWTSGAGEAIGNVQLGSATADTFRLKMQAPWFAYWLKGRGNGRFPKAQLFDAGTKQWRSFDHWPLREAVAKSLYFQANGRLSFEPPTERDGVDRFDSDPARPVPYRQRPIEFGYDWPSSAGWWTWMTEDQRFVDNRPDVLTWVTVPLVEDITIAGDIVARLFASTTGSDADWVVKLIDVYPDSLASRMTGYQLMVAGDILRGRYRRSFERAEPIRARAIEPYIVDLHQQFYTFRRGHRIMAQVQSTWFPLYDRNPQTFVPNIFLAPASAYRAQTHRIHRTAAQPSRIEVMVLPRN
ncbi:MAG: CocE/NonD family hydrolase [Gemmatimonadaceae bacterium]